MQDSLFANVQELPRDPILGLTEAFVADKAPHRVNLGVGVYQDENGKVPLLACVKQAEESLLAKTAPHTYVPIDGLPAYDAAVAQMVFADSADLAKVATVQALGGTGALKLGAELLRVISPNAKVWISDPSWENHRALFTAAGFTVETYPYYGADGELDFAGLIATLSKIPAGDIVLLHACCHNPTGLDLSHDQWRQIAKIVRERGLTPFLDTAYMGFAEGLEADAFSVRLFASDGGPLFVSFSFSKSLSLYGERVGALSVLTASAGGARARPEPAQAHRPHHLFLAARPWRGFGGSGAGRSGPAQAMGRGTRRHARAHQDRCASCWRRSSPSACRAAISPISSARTACSPIRA